MIKQILKNARFWIVAAIFFTACTGTSLLYSFSNVAVEEDVAAVFTSLSKKTITNTVNFDIVNHSPKKQNEANAIFDYCYLNNLYTLAGENYSFRPVINRNCDSYITIDELPDTDVTCLLHSNSAKPHKNKHGEFIHAVYEIELMFDTEDGNYTNQNNTTYIVLRENDAKKIMGKESPSRDDYKRFIDNGLINLTFHKSNTETINYKVGVSNIVVNGKYDDSYFEKVFGSYITMNTVFENSLPCFSSYAVNFDFSNSSYDSKTYLELIKKEFSDNYSFQLNQKIFSNFYGEIVDEQNYISTHIFSKGSLDNIVCFFLSLLLWIIAIFATYLLKHFTKENTNWIVFALIFAYLVEYVFVFIFVRINSHFSSLFTPLSIFTNLILTITSCFFIFSYCYREFRNKEKFAFKDRWCEINI